MGYTYHLLEKPVFQAILDKKIVLKFREEVEKQLASLGEDENDEIEDEDIRMLEEIRKSKTTKNDPWLFSRRRRRRRRCSGPTKQCKNLKYHFI